jgi:tetratricopeptide (TPR) repeat protein
MCHVPRMVAAGSNLLIGREGYLQRIEGFLGDAPAGCGILLLEGEAGIGKTVLWRAGIERARGVGFRVLEARPAAPERELSFAVLGDLLSAAYGEIGGLPAPQRRALRIALLLEEAEGEAPEQRAVGAALRGLLRRLTDEQPLLVALDDLQWIDAPSAAAMQFALRRLEDEPVRVLATSRPEGTLLALDGAERIEVEPLRLEELDQLVRDRLGSRFLRPTLRQLERASGGNPFYALEIAASLLRSGRPLEPGEPLPIPSRLRDVVRDRLSLLSPDARAAALAAAALAQPTVACVRQASSGGLSALSEAVAAGVLERRGETLRFTHPLLASSLYEETSGDERRDLHSRLAELVGDPEERARHLAEAAEGPGEPVAAALEAAAASVARRGAADAAARLAKQAVELTPTDRRAEAHRRTVALGRYSVAAGDPAHAEALLERHFDLAQPGRERAEVELELGSARLATRGIAAAQECYTRALQELENSDDLELRTMVLIELAAMEHAHHVRGTRDDHAGASASEEAVELAEKLGRPGLLSRALGIHAKILILAGEPPPEVYWRQALEVEQESGELHYDGPTAAYGQAAFMRGDLKTIRDAVQQLAASMRRRGDPRLPEVLLGLSEGGRVAGDCDVAARYAQEAHDLVVQTGRESLEPVCLLYKARAALPRGDLGLARADAEQARALVERLPRTDVGRLDVEAVATPYSVKSPPCRASTSRPTTGTRRPSRPTDDSAHLPITRLRRASPPTSSAWSPSVRSIRRPGSSSGSSS